MACAMCATGNVKITRNQLGLRRQYRICPIASSRRARSPLARCVTLYTTLSIYVSTYFSLPITLHLTHFESLLCSLSLSLSFSVSLSPSSRLTTYGRACFCPFNVQSNFRGAIVYRVIERTIVACTLVIFLNS